MRIIALSGKIGVGKSTLCERLVKHAHAKLVKTRELIESIATSQIDGNFTVGRLSLQDYGELLDRETQGRWVADALDRILTECPSESLVVIDSVRIQSQVDELRTRYGLDVFHIHLTADDAVVVQRYSGRTPKFKEFDSYEATRKNATEANIEHLSQKADAFIDTSHCTSDDVWIRAWLAR